MQVISDAGRFTPTGDKPNHFVEQVRVAHLSVGTYSIPVDGFDDQTPHTEDEVYLVMAGRGRLVASSGEVEVGPGSVVFIPAGEEHHFEDVTEDLGLVAVFGPPHRTRACDPAT